LKLSDFQKKAVDILCASQGCGPYDLRCWDKCEWDNPSHVRFVLFNPRLATFDGDGLTKLVILAHELMIRIEIQTVNFNYMAIAMHKRKTREGSISERHPTIETAIESCRKRYAYLKESAHE
jgi:hypothetical protein